MQIDITGRQVEVTPALKRFTSDKLKKLEKLLGGPIEAHVVLVIEKHRHRAEIQVKSRSAMLSGDRTTGDLYASIGEVVDKLERQALKHKEKMTARKRRAGKVAAVPVEIPAVSLLGARVLAKPVPGPRIVRSARYRLKPLTPVDAALELDATGEHLLVYRDAETYRVNVVYRRPDGAFALVDPEF